MAILSLDVLLSQSGTSLLFHVQFYLLFLDLHTDLSGVRSGGLVFPSLEEFFSLLWFTQSKALAQSNQSRSRCFSGILLLFCDPADVGSLLSGSSAFSKSSLNIWNFLVHMLLKPDLENFEYYFASVWDEYNCAVAWTFFGIAFLWDWNENWPFLVT